MWRHVLRLIDDHEGVPDGAAADERHGFDFDEPRVDQPLVGLAGLADLLELRPEDRLGRLHGLGLLLLALRIRGEEALAGRSDLRSRGRAVAGEEDFEVVEVRLDVRRELLLLGPGQRADVLADLHDRTGDVELLVRGEVAEHLGKRGGDGEESLARAGPAEAGHQFDVGIEQRIEEDPLLKVLGDDAHAARHLQALASPAVGRKEFAVEAERDEDVLADVAGGFAPVAGSQHHVLVYGRDGFALQLDLDLGEFLEVAHRGGGHVDRLVVADIAGLDAVVPVVLDLQAEGLRLEGHAGVLGDEDHRALGGVAKVKRRSDDAMVGGVDLHEDGPQALGAFAVEVLADE